MMKEMSIHVLAKICMYDVNFILFTPECANENSDENFESSLVFLYLNVH